MRERVDLTVPEISAWLSGLTRQLDRGITGPHRDTIGELLRWGTEGTRAPLGTLASLALLADCLRVAHIAIEADGICDADEMAHAFPIAEVAARKYFQVLPSYEAFGDGELAPAELLAFLQAHRNDAGPFGGATPERWPGIELCRTTAELANHASLLRDHERMLARVMDAVFAGRATEVESAARRRLRDLFEGAAPAGEDPRALAFCRPHGPEVFSTVAHGLQIHARDPLDVEALHRDARDVFHREIEHAVTPIRHTAGHGRTMLVLGGSGSGKTHLLRAFRAQVHGERLGYVGYLQLTAEVGDYARYVLQNLIDSLEQSYDRPSLTESGLMYMSDGLAEYDDAISPDALEQLRTADLDADATTRLVGELVDRLMRSEGMAVVDSDLVQALLLLQRRDAAIQRRVVKFLRCDGLNAYEQGLLGGLSPRTQPEDPQRTLEQLATLAFQLQHACLVLLVDQVEDAMHDLEGYKRVQRAIDVLRRFADAAPSAVVVIACLDDVYDQLRNRLTQSVIDRLERDPPLVRLSTECRREQVESMLETRLEHLYEAMEVPWREDDRFFPFSAHQLDKVVTKRPRDVLAEFHSYHQDCIRAGRLVGRDLPRTAAPVEPVRHDDLARAWADARTRAASTPDGDVELLSLLARAVDACRAELGMPITATLVKGSRARLSIAAIPGVSERIIEVCNKQAQGGHLGRQIDDLRRSVPATATPVALRVGDFSFKKKSTIASTVGELVASGGLALAVSDAELRALAAWEPFAAQHGAQPQFAAWRGSEQPIAQLPLFRSLLAPASGRSAAAAPVAAAAPAAIPVSPPPERSPEPQLADKRASPTAAPTGAIRLGVGSTLRGEPVHLELEWIKHHAAFLGGTGSGKTTIALHMIEQLLERGVSALLVDRKGDLARYASRAWWDESTRDPELDRRKRALRDRIDVALYTPGDANGRPLGLPVIPPGMAQMPSQEQDQVAKIAASGIAAMMGYGRGEKFTRRAAILKTAIELHGATGEATIEELKATIERPDPQLVAAVGNLGRHFGGLAEDLATLWINNKSLLGNTDQVLDVGSLLRRCGDKAQLVIISTGALTDVTVIQFWVSRLLVELGRYVRNHPSTDLQAVAFFDEAEIYVPATRVPPTKEPMFDLLRRARSGGLGILLASQNPGDFDYGARNNIETWLVGKVKEPVAIEKMRNLLSGYPNVGPRLASQPTGSFFVLSSSALREIKADMSIMKTAQLGIHEIAQIAREQRS